MSRQPYNPNMTKSEYNKLNNKLIPWNIAIAVIALSITILLFFGSFFQVNIRVPIGQFFGDDDYGYNQNINSIVPTDYNDDNGYHNNGDDNDLVFGEIFDNLIDFLQDLDVNLTIAISSFSLLQGLAGSPTQRVVGNTANDIVRQLYAIAFSTIREILPVFTEDLIEGMLQEISENDDIESAEFFEALDSAALVEVFIDIFSGEILAVDARDMLIDILSTAFETVVDDPYDLQEVMDEFGYLIGNFLDILYYDFSNPQGYFDIDLVLMSTLTRALENLDIEIGDEIEGLGATLVAVTLLSISEYFGEIFVTLMDIFFYMMAALHLITIFVWFLQFAFAFLRIFTKKKRVAVGYSGGVGWITFSLFVIIPAIIYLSVMLALGLPLFAYWSVTFIGWTLSSFLGSWAMLIILLAGYGRLKRQVKRAKIIPDSF